MMLGIVAAVGALNYTLIDKKVNQLIEKSGCYAFYVISGYVNGEKSKYTRLASDWAKENGAPVYKISEKSEEELVNKVILKADCVVFLLNGDPVINNSFMRYKMAGKHGSVIKVRRD